MFFLNREVENHDVTALYHQMNDTYQSSDSEIDVVDINQPSTSSGATGRATRASTKKKLKLQLRDNWQSHCRQVLESLWSNPDSQPFR